MEINVCSKEAGEGGYHLTEGEGDNNRTLCNIEMTSDNLWFIYLHKNKDTLLDDIDCKDCIDAYKKLVEKVA